MSALNVVFAGTPEFAVPSLRALLNSQHRVSAVYTQPDRPAGRGKKLQPSPVKQLALAHGLPVLQPETLKGEEAQQQLAAFQPDVMVVVAYGLLLPQRILDTPRLGCINVHGSLLPRWRGAAPVERAIAAGDENTGVVIMQMEAGLDTGPMLKTAVLPIGTKTAAQITGELAELGARTLIQVLDEFAVQPYTGEIQDNSLATYAAKLTKAEGNLDWRLPAEQLARLVRAYNPRPVAFSQIEAEPVRIWNAVSVNEQATAAPGTIVRADKNGIYVACGENLLQLTELQLTGGKVLPVAAILNGKRELFAPGKGFVRVEA
ncbi:MAG TPA: methionyl-tRNA formyltransferase [Pseudomonadales bacterium]|nr:methionyl-tRNA formyltransferase [Pseudomonadales bacterium]